MARGDAHPSSDLDLAIDLLAPADLETHLQWIQAVEEAIPGVRVDFVFLNPRTPPVLRYQVFTEGECLYEGEPGLFDHEFLRAWHLYLDTRRLREYEQAYLRRRSEEAADVP
jgi:predicted nucleotidyltransferase